MIRLKILDEYKSQKRGFDREMIGKVVELDDAEARFLMVDSPGCFQQVSGPGFAGHSSKGPDGPPQDKMITEDLAELKYPALRSLAKSLGLKATGKADAIRDRIEAATKG